MAEYIEREVAVKAILDKEDREIKNDYEFCLGLIVASNAVSDVPAADVAPVRHGRWHSRFYYRETTKAYDCEMHVCSECGSEWSYDAETGSSDFNYCPNCGADMREG